MFSISQILVKISGRRLKISSAVNSTRCIVSLKNEISDYAEIGKTEVSDDCLNPEWRKSFLIAYRFSELQSLQFELRGIGLDDKVSILGKTEILLAQLITEKDGVTTKTLKSLDGNKVGKLSITYEELQTHREGVTMQFSGNNLDKKDLFGKSDPFFVISKDTGDGVFTEVYRSEVIKSTLYPVWKPFSIHSKLLCDSDRQKQLHIDCFDWNRNSDPELIGSFRVTLEKLLVNHSTNQNNYDCLNSELLAKCLDSYTNSGFFVLESIQITDQLSLIDYFRKGMQFHLKVSVDFSTQLTNNENECAKMIVKGINNIVKEYDNQSLLSLSGFGGQLTDKISDEKCDFIEISKYYDSIDDLIKKYEQLLKVAKRMNGKENGKPINIEPIINYISEEIETYLNNRCDKNNHYFIVLLITSSLNNSSIINTINANAKLSSVPFTVIVIDTANHNNNNNNVFDNTKSSKKNDYKRNVVQYFSTNQYSSQTVNSNDWHKWCDKLVRDVLRLIPNQLFEYFDMSSNNSNDDYSEN